MLQEVARKVRQEQTLAEQKLWGMLRAHRCGGFHFRRQCIR
ncbi:MAG: DUF559 domain-containing protein [Armatimonadetes bacterium]|nr:DUF559 domain-containing protein [Armatimonadota bacterium]